MEAKVAFKPLTKKRYRIFINGIMIKGKEGTTKHPKDYAHTFYLKEQNKRNQLKGVNVKNITTTNNSYKKPAEWEILEKKLRGFFWSEIQHRFIHY